MATIDGSTEIARAPEDVFAYRPLPLPRVARQRDLSTLRR
jgi:hypothetical protein